MRTTTHCPYYAYIPRNLYLKKLLKSCPPDLSHNCGRKEIVYLNCVFLLSQIYYARKYYNWNFEWLEKSSFVPLSAEVLQSAIKKYRQYLDYLTSHGIIECDGVYQPKRKNKGYRFTEKYRESRLKLVLITDPSALKRFNRDRYKKNSKAKEKYSQLVEMFNNLDYDQVIAMDILKSLTKKVRQETTDSSGKKQVSTKRVKLNAQDRVRLRRQLHLVRRHECGNFKVCDTGRFFTPISHIPKELRKCLRYIRKPTTNPTGEGIQQPLIGVDISNCVPYLTISLLKPSIFKKFPVFKELVTKWVDKRIRNRMIPIMLGKWSHNLEDLPDVREYISDVLSGFIYEKFQDALHRMMPEVYGKSEDERKVVKKALLKIANSPKWLETPEKEILKGLYPSMVWLFDTLNGNFRTRRQNPKPGAKKAPFASITQGIEAWFVLDNVVPAILKKYPECPIFTIHDCIYTIPEYVEIVKTFLIDESRRIFEYPCGLKIED